MIDRSLFEAFITTVVVKVHYLDEFVFSVTNRPPTVQKIESGRFMGIHRPTIYMLGFDGHGHSIYAINWWGTSKTQRSIDRYHSTWLRRSSPRESSGRRLS